MTTRTHLYTLINITIWLEDRGDSPTDIDVELMFGVHKWPLLIK